MGYAPGTEPCRQRLPVHYVQCVGSGGHGHPGTCQENLPGNQGAKPGKRSPDNHHIWNEAQIIRWRNQKPREQGDHDIL
eukprot:6564089-Heterocapsa_arctica.AAC.1